MQNASTSLNPLKKWSPTAPVTELHRHLDVSVRASTMLMLAQQRGLEGQSTSLEHFCEKLYLKKPLQDLGQVLAKFELFQRVLDRPDVLAQVTFEVIEDAHIEGIEAIELRFSPSFIGYLNHLPWSDCLEGILQGVRKAATFYPHLKVGLICIASRDYGVTSVEKTVEFFLKNQVHFVGLDLAGDEIKFKNKLFEPSFKSALKSGAQITVHAGEALPAYAVWEAIELLGAKRIGHGIHAIEDPSLLRYLAQNNIALEVCPTSNWLTQAVPTIKEHPLKRLLQSGVPVCLGTDDPGVFDVTLAHEVEVAANQLGLGEEQIKTLFSTAWKYSFLNHEVG